MTAYQPPQSIEAEEALLGACLLNPAVIGKLNITAADFYVVRNQWIWEALSKLARGGANVDPITLAAELQRGGKLAEAGGAGRITDLITRTPSSLHAEDYAAVIREKAQRRRILDTCNNLVKAMYSGEPIDGIIAKAMTELSRSAQPDGGAVHWSEFLSDFYDTVEQRCQNPKEIYGIPTGIEDYDLITGGLQQGEILIISGEPGLGKTLLAFQMVTQLAKSQPGAVYELEMGLNAVLRRAMSAEAKITTRAMKSGFMSEDDWSAFIKGTESLAKLPVYTTKRINWTTTQMRSDLARLKEVYGVTWFLVDYMDLLRDTGFDAIDRSRVISAALHDICLDLDLAGIVIQSMNKSGMRDEVKDKSSLSGASKVVYDADLILMMQHYKDDPDRLITCTFEKNREGDSDRNAFKLWRGKTFPVFTAAKS